MLTDPREREVWRLVEAGEAQKKKRMEYYLSSLDQKALSRTNFVDMPVRMNNNNQPCCAQGDEEGRKTGASNLSTRFQKPGRWLTIPCGSDGHY